MTDSVNLSNTWGEAARALLHPKVITMLFLGFTAGLPLLLIFSTLSLWLREAGIDRADVTFFSWAALAYSFKFIWAPLVDKLPLPFLTRRLGRRRAWLLLAQCGMITATLLMALTDPAQAGGLIRMGIAAVLLGLTSATQDIVIDAYRIESAPGELQAMLSSSYIAGYRIGMLVTGAGTLFLASMLGSKLGAYHYSAWMFTYLAMAAAMLVGPITTILMQEHVSVHSISSERSLKDNLGLLIVFFGAATVFASSFWSLGTITTQLWPLASGAPLSILGEVLRLGGALLATWLAIRLFVALNLVKSTVLNETYASPILEFFQRYEVNTAWVLLALIGVYRIADIVLGVISNVFYQDMGFTKIEIASIVKSYGLFMTLLGGFLGGALTLRYGVVRILILGTVLSTCTHLLFLLLAQTGHYIPTLYLVISADNLSAGLSSAAFVAFISSLTSISFTAVQYAIFSSIMTLLPKLLGGYSGTLVEIMGYQNFFLFTSLLGLPVLLLVLQAQRLLNKAKYK